MENQRIEDKIIEVEKYLDELEQIKISEYDLYEKDFKTRGLYERYFEKIIEAITDLAFIFTKHKGLKLLKKKTRSLTFL